MKATANYKSELQIARQQSDILGKTTNQGKQI